MLNDSEHNNNNNNNNNIGNNFNRNLFSFILLRKFF